MEKPDEPMPSKDEDVEMAEEEVPKPDSGTKQLTEQMAKASVEDNNVSLPPKATTEDEWQKLKIQN